MTFIMALHYASRRDNNNAQPKGLIINIYFYLPVRMNVPKIHGAQMLYPKMIFWLAVNWVELSWLFSYFVRAAHSHENLTCISQVNE